MNHPPDLSLIENMDDPQGLLTETHESNLGNEEEDQVVFEVYDERWEEVPDGEMIGIKQEQNHDASDQQNVLMDDSMGAAPSDSLNHNYEYIEEGAHGEEIYEELPEGYQYVEEEEYTPETDGRITDVIDTVASTHYHDEHAPYVDEYTVGSSRRQATVVECEICGAILKHPSKIQAHMRTHTGEKPFECDICGKRFSQRTPWKNHVKHHLGDTPYQCSCGKKFACNAVRNAHELRHRGEKRKGPPRPHLKPPKRTVMFDEPQRVVEEERSAIIEYQPPFGHINSPLSVAAAKRIDDIIEAVASGGSVPPKKPTNRRAAVMGECQICGLLLKHPSKIQAHMRTHTGERPYECAVCGQRFTQPHPLRMHIRRKHTGEKPFTCTWECGMKFISLAARNEHEKIVHAGIKRYECTATGCRRMFTRRRYLMMHRAKDHPHLYEPVVDSVSRRKNQMLLELDTVLGHDNHNEEMIFDEDGYYVGDEDEEFLFNGEFVEEEEERVEGADGQRQPQYAIVKTEGYSMDESHSGNEHGMPVLIRGNVQDVQPSSMSQQHHVEEEELLEHDGVHSMDFHPESLQLGDGDLHVVEEEEVEEEHEMVPIPRWGHPRILRVVSHSRKQQ